MVGGLPGYSSQHNHALSCLQFALHMQNDMKVIRNACGVDVELRIGIHTGSVIGSVVSLNKPKYLLWGSATQVAGAMEAYGTPGSIQISRYILASLSNYIVLLMRYYNVVSYSFVYIGTLIEVTGRH